MKGSIRVLVAITVLLFASGALAQEGSTGGGGAELQVSPRSPQAGNIYVPTSSRPQAGQFAHTTYVLRSPDGGKPAALSTPTAAAVAGPLSTTEVAETPASMGCLYVKSPSRAGCVPNHNPGTGGPSPAGYGAIAIVDAFDNPDAASDLATFDSYWGLAAPPSFTKIYANGNGDCTTPPPDPGWALEESLDIEWAHVFAPKAAIVLVEACSNSYTDLFYAEQVAFNYIVDNYPAGGQVTNSWQGPELSNEIQYDPLFADWNYNGVTGFKTPILAFASSGDGGFEGSTTGYPSGNPWLISAGGTSVLRNASNLYFSSEACWGGSGGGSSTYETYVTSWTGGNVGPWANFQYPIYGGTFGPAHRQTPDLSFNADPASGVEVYSLYGWGGWVQVGGTSVSSPSLASIINRAGNRLGSVFLTPITGGGDWFSTWENNLLYSQLATAKAYATNFYDVTTGSNGTSAVKSYDLCTGVGSPRGLLGK
jgi:subtilase family serine protease